MGKSEIGRKICVLPAQLMENKNDEHAAEMIYIHDALRPGFNSNNNEMRMGEVHAVKINLPLLFYYSTPGGADFSEKRATRR
jgi:hypothetical protein